MYDKKDDQKIRGDIEDTLISYQFRFFVDKPTIIPNLIYYLYCYCVLYN